MVIGVVSELVLGKDANNGEYSKASKVPIEGILKGEGTCREFLEESDLVGEVTCEHGDTSYEGVSTNEGGQVDNDGLAEFPGDESANDGETEGKDHEEGDVLDPLGEDQVVEGEAEEEASSETEDGSTDSSCLLDEPSNEDSNSQSEDEAEDSCGDFSAWLGWFLLKGSEATECGGDKDHDHEGETSTDWGEHVGEELATEESGDDTESEEEDTYDPGVVCDEFNDGGGLEDGAAGGVLGVHLDCALLGINVLGFKWGQGVLSTTLWVASDFVVGDEGEDGAVGKLGTFLLEVLLEGEVSVSILILKSLSLLSGVNVWVSGFDTLLVGVGLLGGRLSSGLVFDINFERLAEAELEAALGVDWVVLSKRLKVKDGQVVVEGATYLVEVVYFDKEHGAL